MRRRVRRPPRAQTSVAAEEKAALAIAALADRRAVDPVVLDMREVTIVTDYFLICHGTSNVHIRGLADAVREALEKESLRPYGVEGYQEAGWILLDYGDVIMHIFSEEARAFYDLERLWSDAPQVTADQSVESGDHV